MTWSWAPSSRGAEFVDRLNEELESWRGTPYAQGQRCKGAGVDCVRFACAIMDVVFGEVTIKLTLPQDAAFHTRAGAPLLRSSRPRSWSLGMWWSRALTVGALATP